MKNLVKVIFKQHLNLVILYPTQKNIKDKKVVQYNIANYPSPSV